MIQLSDDMIEVLSKTVVANNGIHKLSFLQKNYKDDAGLSMSKGYWIIDPECRLVSHCDTLEEAYQVFDRDPSS